MINMQYTCRIKRVLDSTHLVHSDITLKSKGVFFLGFQIQNTALTDDNVQDR